MGCGVVERHLEMAPPIKKTIVFMGENESLIDTTANGLFCQNGGGDIGQLQRVNVGLD